MKSFTEYPKFQDVRHEILLPSANVPVAKPCDPGIFRVLIYGLALIAGATIPVCVFWLHPFLTAASILMVALLANVFTRMINLFKHRH